MKQVLFLQGGGAGVHDEWDHRLVASLAEGLGEAYEVRYPRMPAEDDPSYEGWGPAIRSELAALDDGAVVVAHSIGATLLMRVLADQPDRRLATIVLVAAPFVGDGGWPGDEPDLSAVGTPVHRFHGLADDTAPPGHADLYARALPHAEVHKLPGRDHQLDDDLREVATLLRA